MINLARICVIFFLKILYNARFFNDLIQIVWFSSSSRFLDSSFWSSSRLAFSDDRFWNLSYRWKIFLHVSRCLRNWHSSDDRMIDFDQVLRSSSSDFHQVHDFQVWFSSSSSFKLSDAAFWNLSYWWNFLIKVSRCMRKRHSNAIVDIIER